MKILGQKLSCLLSVILLVISINVNGQVTQQEYLQTLKVQVEEINKSTPIDIGDVATLISAQLDYTNKCVIYKYNLKPNEQFKLSLSKSKYRSLISQTAKDEMLKLVWNSNELLEPYQYGIGSKYVYYYENKLAYEFEISPSEALRK